ncbi:DUF2244 domain-containing protein [Sneathiella glossodoripedis]|uniref:DUF2244 domain-containing protein n=1 Tax=Sneathiella glossodoripedis TaxID=418853 RepID=UPI00046EE010|nr:DUF2244 domain-containing protein [Sneathiella glossodoripedis]
MTQDPLTPKISGVDYSLLLRPHRSLSPRAFLILMSFIAGVSFIIGAVFASMGAWPVFGFFGLDVLLIYWAFKWNFRSGRCCEIIEITNGKLVIKKIAVGGQEKRWAMDTYWSKVDFKNKRILVSCRGTQHEIGEFLVPDEKEEVFNNLSAALRRSQNPVFA